MNTLLVGGIEVKLRKEKTEYFNSALLALVTTLSKQGFEVTDVVARPYKSDGFYNIEYQVFSYNKQVAESLFSMNDDPDSFFSYLLDEQDVNEEYNLNAKFIPFPGAPKVMRL